MSALLSLLVALVAAQPPKEPADDVTLLQGKWKLTGYRVVNDEFAVDGDRFPSLIVEFKKDEFTITAVDSKRATISTGKVKYDTAKKTITLVDIEYVDGQGRKVNGPTKASTTYVLKNGNLIFVVGPGKDGAEPRDPTKPDMNTVFQTFVRQKD